MTTLLDGNVLIALGDRDHVHHGATEQWFAARRQRAFATCPITQSTLLRHLMREGITDRIGGALEILKGFQEHPDHRFWPDSIGYDAIDWRGVLGHRQVTDAYLAGLARAHGGGLATLDRGMASLHEDVVELIPV